MEPRGGINGKRGTAALRFDANHEDFQGSHGDSMETTSRGGPDDAQLPLDNTGIEWNIGAMVAYEAECWDAKLYRRNVRRNGICLCVRNETTSISRHSF